MAIKKVAKEESAGKYARKTKMMGLFHLTIHALFLTIYLSIINMEENMETTISSKYQVVIPKVVRERMNLQPKQKLTVLEKDDMVILVPQKNLESLRGIAKGADLNNYRDKKDRF